MTSVDFHLAIRNHLLDEVRDFLDDDRLDWIHLAHNALHTLLKKNDLIMKLVIHLLRVACLNLSSLTVLAIYVFHIYQQVVVLNLGLRHLLLGRPNTLIFDHLAVEHLLVGQVFLIGLIVGILAAIERLFVLFPEVVGIDELLVNVVHVPQFGLEIPQQVLTFVVIDLVAELLE